MRKLIWLVAAVITVLLLVLYRFPRLLLPVPEPVRSGELTLPALRAPVKVYFDRYAVPHLYAGDEHDLFYAAGYLMASERLFQMDMINRAAQGRLAEMSAGLLSTDRYLRTWGFHHIGKQLAARLDPELRGLLEASCAGINYYINSHRDALPVEFRLAGHQPLEWDLSVVMAYGRLMGHELNQSWFPELIFGLILRTFGEQYARDLYPAYPDDKPFVVPPGSAPVSHLLEPLADVLSTAAEPLGGTGGLGGSNNWVVAGHRTVTGRPLLANDIHLGFTQPPKLYEMHLVGGRFNVRGLFFPGIPLAVLGHNEHIAWGFTNVMTDDIDFYEEEVNPDDPATYRYRDQWVPFEVRQEIISVSGGPPDTMLVRNTVHGVIISDLHPLARQEEQLIAMRWTGQEMTDEARGMLDLNLAHNWEDFTAAAALYAVPGQNVVYADRAGNIGWRPFVKLPLRREGSGLLVMPGASGEWDWQGFVPFDEMPFLFNPPAGYIATANNRTIGPEFPYYISAYWAPPARIERITELLAERERHSLESTMAIQTDLLSIQARELVPYLLAAHSPDPGGQSPSGHTAEALERLAAWDFVMGTESVPATIFNAWFGHLVAAIYRDEMDRAGDQVYDYYTRMAGYLPMRNIPRLLRQGASPWFDNLDTPQVETGDDCIRLALAAALADLEQSLGGRMSRWQWGRVHTLTHPHDLAKSGTLGRLLDAWLGLDVGPFPAAGANATVNPGHFKLSDPFQVTAGPSVRRVIDIGEWDNSLIVLPTGQSGHPFSPHYSDQAQLFVDGQYRRVDFTREAVLAGAVDSLVLKP
ncbi:MAG: penicillin acylase family protein [Candidatus Marinimicrobia bacterium]|nr:penicillin acylase family protein [Candidatus Neomarinimicrobiota bacterium]